MSILPMILAMPESLKGSTALFPIPGMALPPAYHCKTLPGPSKAAREGRRLAFLSQKAELIKERRSSVTQCLKRFQI